jgi:predicted O-methyltransferase YrrM
MGIRRTVASTLEATIGRERTSAIRKVERRARLALARKLTMEPQRRPAAKRAAQPTAKPAVAKPQTAVKPPGWQPPDPYASYPEPRMSRHELLRGLQEKTRPRTYLEIGVSTGASMALSRARSIGVDPAFRVDMPIHCDLQLVRATSDSFFAQDDPLAHFEGVPVDLAFIDGMHLSEFALRDFINTERLMADTGVVVFDDMLPRNGLEAARDRKTSAWAGDVYKVIEILLRRRPDLVVLLVNTTPTGTAVVVGVDQASNILKEAYGDEEEYLRRPDPQLPPQEYMDRSIAVQPDVLLASPVWEKLVACRESGASADLDMLWNELRALQHVNPMV